MPTVNRMEIEGTMHDIEDTTARESVTGISARLTTAETKIETLSETVESLNTVSRFSVPSSAANTNVLDTSLGFQVSVTTMGNLQLLSGGAVFKERGSKVNVKLLTLPVGYRPKWTVEGGAYTTGDNQPLRLWVETDGSVYVYNSADSTEGYLFIHAVYAKV